MKRIFLVLLCGLLITASCSYRKKITATNVRLSPVFTSGMILKASPHAVISGYADPGGVVAVRIAEYLRMDQADKQGRWSVSFPEIETKTPFEIRVEAADTIIILREVLPGKTFLVGGNAGLSAFDIIDVKSQGKIKISEEDYPLRIFLMGPDGGKWYTYDALQHKAEVVASLKAVQQKLPTSEGPVGLICLSEPAADLSTWLSPESELLAELRGKEDSVTRPFILYNPALTDSIIWLRDSSRTGFEKRIDRIWYKDDSWRSAGMPKLFGNHEKADSKKILYLRKKLQISPRFVSSDFTLDLGVVSGKAEYYFNQEQISPEYLAEKTILTIPDTLFTGYSNMLLVRLFLEDTLSGFHGPELTCYNADSSYYATLVEGWKYNFDLEPDFPVYTTYLATPSLLYQERIAPLKDVQLEAAFWYDSYDGDSLLYKNTMAEVMEYFNADRIQLLKPVKRFFRKMMN